MDKRLLALFFLIIFSSNVFALGITPGRTNIDFSPGAEQTFELTIINSEHKDMDLIVQTRGEMKDVVQLEIDKIKMSAGEYEKKIKVKLKIPLEMKPGAHGAEVVVIQSPSESHLDGPATVGMALAVATQIQIRVPYPGKYLEGEVKVMGDEKEKKIYVVAVNRGSEDIVQVKAQVNIFDASGKEVKVLDSDAISLKAGEQKDIGVTWKVDAPLGKYTAKAVVEYDGQKILFESGFEVGDLVLEMLNLFVTDFTLGNIAKFNLLVQNKWSEPFNKAYAQMRVLDKDFNEITDIKSSTYDIPAGEKTTMIYYWDTKDVKEGLYNANVILHYADKKTQQDLKLNVGKDSIEVIGLGRVISSEEEGSGSNLVTIMGIVIGFLVLLNILWFVVLRKKK